MVAPLERNVYMYELRGVVENIVHERLENSQRQPPVQHRPVIDERDELQESFRESSANLVNAEASEVDQPPPQTPCATQGSPSPPAPSQAIPVFVIPMTQEKTLESLPSQLDFDWQDSLSTNPTPAAAAECARSPKAMEVDEFVMVSQIAEEAVKSATEQLPQPETCPSSKNTNI